MKKFDFFVCLLFLFRFSFMLKNCCNNLAPTRSAGAFFFYSLGSSAVFSNPSCFIHIY